MTNFDKIKKMTADEFLQWLFEFDMCEICPRMENEICFEEDDCKNAYREWLMNEVKNEYCRVESDCG